MSESCVRNSSLMWLLQSCSKTAVVLAAGYVLLAAPAAKANGFGESRPWQFETSSDKIAKANALDLIERKKGGFYDGFTTVVYTTTNIGEQINCSVGSSTNANIADNSQAGAAPTADPSTIVSSSAAGSSSVVTPNESGVDSGSADSVSNTQSNSGALVSGTSGTSVNSSLNGVGIGDTAQDLQNNQTNSGQLTSSIADSVACAMDGATLTGSVQSNVDGVTYGPLN